MGWENGVRTSAVVGDIMRETQGLSISGVGIFRNFHAPENKVVYGLCSVEIQIQDDLSTKTSEEGVHHAFVYKLSLL